MRRLRRNTGPQMVRERLADSFATLAALLRQTAMDASGLSLARLTMSPDFGETFWRMRALGEEQRVRTAVELYHHDKHFGIVPDPRGHIPYSTRAFVLQAARSVGATLMVQGEAERLYVEYLTHAQRLIYAWMRTYPDHRPPDFFIDDSPPPGVSEEEHQARWTFQAAQVLGHYIINHMMHEGGMVPAGLILPPDPEREAAWAVLMHQFAKALLFLADDCPHVAPCKCNEVRWRAREVPVLHPEETGTLSLNSHSPHNPHQPPKPDPIPPRQTRPTSHQTSHPTLRAMQQQQQNHPSYPSQPSQPSEPNWGNADPQVTGSRGGKPHNGLDDTQRLDRGK